MIQVRRVVRLPSLCPPCGEAAFTFSLLSVRRVVLQPSLCPLCDEAAFSLSPSLHLPQQAAKKRGVGCVKSDWQQNEVEKCVSAFIF